MPLHIVLDTVHRDDDYPLTLAHGRVLHQPGHAPRIVSRDGKNYIERDELIEVHPEDARELGIEEDDLIDVRARPEAGQPNAALTGYARLTSPHRGLVCAATLFGAIATAMQDSEDPDPAPRISGLPLRRISVAKSPVLAETVPS